MAQTSLNSTGVASSGSLSLQSNGTTEAIGISTGQVATLAQNPILTSGTVNGLAFLNASKVLTTGSALTFDGSSLGVAAGNINLGNAFFLNGRNTANTAFVPIVKVAAGDILEFGSGGFNANFTGNVGIGTSSPVGKLHVSAATVSSDIISANTNIGISSNNKFGFAIYEGSAEVASFRYFRDGTGNSQLAGSSTLLFNTSGTERARIDSSGQFLVGCTVLPASGRAKGFGARASTTGGFQVYQNASVSDWAINVTSGSCVNFYSDNGSALVYAGSINVSGNTTSYTSVSDYRLKENVQPMTGALANVLALKPVTFTFKDSGQDSQGFIAHELQAVVPDAVIGIKDAVREEQYEVTPAVKDADGNTITEAVMGTRTVPAYQGIDTSFLVATLTAAIQEQQALIQSLTARLDAANL